MRFDRMEDIDTLLVIDEQVVFLIRCRPWRAKRRPVVPGRRRRGRLAGVADGRSPEAAEARCKRIRYAVKPFDGGPWRSPTAPLGARRDGAVARSGANRGTRVVAERKAKGGLGRPVSHPEHGDTPSSAPGDHSNHLSPAQCSSPSNARMRSRPSPIALAGYWCSA